MAISTTLRKPPVVLAAGTLLIGFAILFRIQSLYPIVFSDEWSYSRMARLQPFSEAAIPSFLYLWVYKLTNVCGDGFLSCARLMNAAFFFSAVVFVYLIAKKVVPPALAVWVALLAVFGPINSYTSYFMPEAMFFFFFWLFSWSLLRFGTTHEPVDLIVPAFLFGLLTLVKPHPVFMYPALIVYLGYLSRRPAYIAWLGVWAIRSAIFVGVSIFTKLAISYAFAGKAGLTLFGGVYNSIASQASGSGKYFAIASNAAASLGGHLMILATLFGAAICAMFYAATKAVAQKEESNELHKMAIFAFLVIGSMVGLSAIFSASVIGMGPGESLARVHMRYYNFALPFFLILAGGQISDGTRRSPYLIAVIALAVAGLAAYAISTRLSGFFIPSWVDAPEASAASDLPADYYLLAMFGLFATIVWAINRRLGSQIYLFVFAPIMIAVNLYAVNLFIRRYEQPDVYDRAGIVVRQLFPRSERSNVTLYGSDPGYLSKVQFHIDNRLVNAVETGPASRPDLASIRGTKKIAVVFEPNLTVPAGVSETRSDGFSIYTSTLPPEFEVNFTKPRPFGGLASAAGVSIPEQWGAWSEGDLVTLKFTKPLPKTLRVRLAAKAFGPNVGKTFTMSIGNSTKDFSLTNVNSAVAFTFENPGLSDTIRISVPQPISPLEINVARDARKLGIGMTELQIERLD